MSVAGIWAAVLTPVDEHASPEPARAVKYYCDLLERGCDGINLLGTTGEAMSFSARQRMAFMESVATSGLPMARVMVGTGAASLDDAVQLTASAFAAGFAAALVMPPFFFRDAGDDGIVRFFDALFSRTNPASSRVLLYNFPRMSGITFRPELVDRLLTEFPGIIGGMKDSSNDARLQREILARQQDFAILPGSERDLFGAKARGVTGCISGSVGLWPRLARKAFMETGTDASERLSRARGALDGFTFIPAVRYLTAKAYRDDGWRRAMPPVVPLSDEEESVLERSAEPFLETAR